MDWLIDFYTPLALENRAVSYTIAFMLASLLVLAVYLFSLAVQVVVSVRDARDSVIRALDAESEVQARFEDHDD